MPRFLSRGGTGIDDLERQLARVGSNENDTSGDEAIAKGVLAGEATPLLRRQGGGVARGQHADAQYQRDGDVTHGGRALVSPPPPPTAIAGTSGLRKLGTWDGVFMPVMLSIWGILVFVRMGYFLSQLGIVGTAASFACGYLVTTMTTLSISAISTNGTVKGGGPYYMLSRSLGPEFGGSIGLMFYLGTLLSAVLNTVAFVEPLLNNFGQTQGDLSHTIPEGPGWNIMYSSVLYTLCVIVCLTGARAFARASTLLSTFIIAATALVLVSFAMRQPFVNEEKSVYYTGWSMATFRENMWPDLTPLAAGRPAETFGSVLGVLFPACIGIMAGASMSSTLRKPSKSIPKGTLWAVLITFVLYMAITIGLGATTRRVTLRENFNVLQEISILPLAMPVGAIVTSVTSTLSGVLAAASVLQAIARDDLFALLRPLRQRRGDDPTRAILATFALGQLAFFVGDTNAVAPFTTMFNLIMFAFVNVACLVLRLGASVNFRPTFHYFKAWTAALGAVGCFALMGAVDVAAALASTAAVVVLFLYVHYTCPPKPWGDVTQSLIYHQCRKYMLRLDLRKDHVKFWRPQILLLVHNPRSSLQLIRFCNALKKGGLYVIGHVIKGNFYEMLPELQRQEPAWLRLIDVLRVKAFVNLAIDESDDGGVRSIAFGAGLGGMRPNIAVLGALDANCDQDSRLMAGSEALPTDGILLNAPVSHTAYVRIIEDLMAMGKAVGVAYGFAGLRFPTAAAATMAGRRADQQQPSVLPLTCPPPRDAARGRQYIDLWPIQIGTAAGMPATAGAGMRAYLTNFDSYVMVLQLGTVLHLVPDWGRRYQLRVMCFVEDPTDIDEEYRRVVKLLRDLRVDAELRVHALRSAGLATYDKAAAAASCKQPASARETGASTAQPIQAVRQPSVKSGAFSMMVNLPMPPRYEATRSAGGCSAASISSIASSSSSELGFESDPDSIHEAGGLPRSRTLGDHVRRHTLRLGALAARGRGLLSISRRRSDGAVVLPGFYSRSLPVAPGSMQPSGDELVPQDEESDEESDSDEGVTIQTTEFNDMPVKTQNGILNELMRRHSSAESTALIFTTLQAPEPGTSSSEHRAREYLGDINALIHGLPPAFLVHATSLTVTTSL